MARRKLVLVSGRGYGKARELEREREREPEPVLRTRHGHRYRVVKPETTATQLDRFFAERKLEPHGDGSFENAEPLDEKTRRTKSRGSNKSST